MPKVMNRNGLVNIVIKKVGSTVYR